MEKQIKIIQIISIAVILLFALMSAFDCIDVYKEYQGYSQMPIEDLENITEPSVTEQSYDNQLLKVSIVGAIEIALIIMTCFKLNIVAAVIELFMTIGTLCTGYLVGQLAPIVGAGRPEYTVTFEITAIGYVVLLLATINLVMSIVLQNKKKALVRGGCEYATSNCSNGV